MRVERGDPHRVKDVQVTCDDDPDPIELRILGETPNGDGVTTLQLLEALTLGKALIERPEGAVRQALKDHQVAAERESLKQNTR